jgi:hypothetical protein
MGVHILQIESSDGNAWGYSVVPTSSSVAV